MNRTAQKVNEKNLRRLAWLKGYTGVSGLARALGRHRTTLHRAARNPGGFRSTYALLEKTLL